MITKEQITTALVSLEVGGKCSLFVLLGADGTINRMGTGSANVTESHLFIGRTTEPLFQQLMAPIDNDIFQHVGVFDTSNPQGEKCKLVVLFQVGTETIGFEFHYGAESQGPPEEITKIVKEAVRLTNPWFQEQKDRVAKSNQ